MKTLKRFLKLYWPMFIALAMMFWSIWGLKGNYVIWFLNDEFHEIACYSGLVFSGMINMVGVAAKWRCKAKQQQVEMLNMAIKLKGAERDYERLQSNFGKAANRIKKLKKGSGILEN